MIDEYESNIGHDADPRQGELNLPFHLAGRSLESYLDFVKWPALVVIILEIILFLHPLISERLPRLIELLTFVLLAVLAIKKRFTRGQVLVAGIISGILIGLGAAIFKLIWVRSLWTFFNLLSEPAIDGLFGLLTVFLIYSILKNGGTDTQIARE